MWLIVVSYITKSTDGTSHFRALKKHERFDKYYVLSMD